MPCVCILKAKIEEPSSKSESTFVNQLKASVQKRLSCYETNEAFLTVSALSHRAELITKATTIARNDSVTAHTDEPPPIKKCRGFFSMLITIAENPASTTTSTESDVEDYLTSSCMAEDTDPLSQH